MHALDCGKHGNGVGGMGSDDLLSFVVKIHPAQQCFVISLDSLLKRSLQKIKLKREPPSQLFTNVVACRCESPK